MEIVLGDETRYDDYGNFWFKDKSGEERKIGTKRKDFDELCTTIIENPGRAVTLNFAVYDKHPYIVGVELLSEKITVDEAKITAPQAEPSEPKAVASQTKPAPQELGMWWKELGECIRSGMIGRDYPNSHIKIKTQYYKKLFDVIGVKEE